MVKQGSLLPMHLHICEKNIKLCTYKSWYSVQNNDDICFFDTKNWWKNKETSHKTSIFKRVWCLVTYLRIISNSHTLYCIFMHLFCTFINIFMIHQSVNPEFDHKIYTHFWWKIQHLKATDLPFPKKYIFSKFFGI